jgi:hypothetical protein
MQRRDHIIKRLNGCCFYGGRPATWGDLVNLNALLAQQQTVKHASNGYAIGAFLRKSEAGR